MVQFPRRLAATVLVAGLFVSALSALFSPTAGASISRTTLLRHLLTLSNFPVGWQTGGATKSGLTGAFGLGGCFPHETKSPRSRNAVLGETQNFTTKKGFPSVREELASGTAQVKAFALLEKEFSRCPSFTTKSGDTVLKTVIEPVGLPAVDKGARAFLVTTSSAKRMIQVEKFDVLFRTKLYVGTITITTAGYAGKPDNAYSTGSLAIVNEAIDKAEGKAEPGFPTTPTT